MSSYRLELAAGVAERPADEGILTPAAIEFLAELVARFGPRVEQLLRAREQQLLDTRSEAGNELG